MKMENGIGYLIIIAGILLAVDGVQLFGTPVFPDVKVTPWDVISRSMNTASILGGTLNIPISPGVEFLIGAFLLSAGIALSFKPELRRIIGLLFLIGSCFMIWQNWIGYVDFVSKVPGWAQWLFVMPGFVGFMIFSSPFIIGIAIAAWMLLK